MPKRFIYRAYKVRSNKSGPSFPEERKDSDYAIQSVLELEEKRLERMLTLREIADIMQHFCSSDESEGLPSFASNYSKRPSIFHPKKH